MVCLFNLVYSRIALVYMHMSICLLLFNLMLMDKLFCIITILKLNKLARARNESG